MDKFVFYPRIFIICNFILRQAHLKRLDEIKEYKHLIKSFKIKDKEYFELVNMT